MTSGSNGTIGLNRTAARKRPGWSKMCSPPRWPRWSSRQRRSSSGRSRTPLRRLRRTRPARGCERGGLRGRRRPRRGGGRSEGRRTRRPCRGGRGWRRRGRGLAPSGIRSSSFPPVPCKSEERRAGLVVTWKVAMDETEVRGHALSPAGTCSGGRTSSSLSRRVSSQGGSLRCVPSSASPSSTAKPGGSVAISNRTPPGSRK